MTCYGCYKDSTASYCATCRKKLFDGAKIAASLSIAAPTMENLNEFQQHSKQLSISGVQLKYSLRREGDSLQLSDKKGQYILKPVPPSRQLANPEAVPENEHLTMQIAEQVFGINTAPNALMQFSDGSPAYLTRRFDVRPDGSKIMQEDFAQLSSRSEQTHGKTYKYDASYEEIGGLIKKYVAASMPALEKFFSIIVFNYLFSNGDAHLKNFSLQRAGTGEYVLAPAYDLICTVMHTPLESDVALDLYGGDMNTAFHRRYGFYGREDFMELAHRLGLVKKRAERIIDELTGSENVVEGFVQRSFLANAHKEQYLRYYHDKRQRFTLKA